MILYTGWRVKKISIWKECPSKSVCWHALLASIHRRGYWVGIDHLYVILQCQIG